MLVANRRTQELEPEHWNDKVFTGDNPNTLAKMTREQMAKSMSSTKKSTMGDLV